MVLRFGLACAAVDVRCHEALAAAAESYGRLEAEVPGQRGANASACDVADRALSALCSVTVAAPIP
jgi:hypothetical protein